MEHSVSVWGNLLFLDIISGYKHFKCPNTDVNDEGRAFPIKAVFFHPLHMSQIHWLILIPY